MCSPYVQPDVPTMYRLQSHNERILRMARRPYNVLTTVAQQINPTYVTEICPSRRVGHFKAPC